MKSILIAAPIHESKEYIIDEYLENLKDIIYRTRLSFDTSCLMVDNSDTFDMMFRLEDKYDHIMFISDEIKAKTSQERQCHSLEVIRRFAVRNNFDYLMLIESDILPNKDIINHLIEHDKDICSAVYWIGEKKKVLMITKKEVIANNKTFPALFVLPDFINGELKRVPNGCGLGCLLIKRKVLEKIKFRWGRNHADTYFHEDIRSYGFKAFVDTSQIVRHYPGRNKEVK